jgi:hypothetical protein
MRPVTRALKAFFRCPRERRAANLDAAAFDHQVVLWSTVQNGVYGRLDPKSGQWPVFYLRVELAQTARAAPPPRRRTNGEMRSRPPERASGVRARFAHRRLN